MRMFSACCSHHIIYVITTSAFFVLCIFSTSLSDAGFSRMKISLSVGASNLTNNYPNSSYKSRRLLDVGRSNPGISESTGKREACAKENIVVNQGATTPMPNGIPTYTVEILNNCVTGHPIAEIHLSCGWFSSATMIDPKIFKRLKDNDCLVNDGKQLKAGGSISFQYANTFPYPLAVSSVKCL